MAGKIGTLGIALLRAMSDALGVEGVRRAPTMLNTDEVLTTWQLNSPAQALPDGGQGSAMVGSEAYAIGGVSFVELWIVGIVPT